MFDHHVSLVARLAGALVPLAAVILAASGAALVGGLTGEEGQMLTDDVAIQVTSERGSATSGQPADGRPLDAAIAGAPAPRFVTVATGVRLEYVEQGRADGLPVIFLHGVTDSWRSFELLLQRLPASIRAFAISQRGHGDSSRPDIGYRYRDFSEDVRAFMDAIGLERAVVVGHSMGAMVSQRLIVDHPQRVSHVVLMGAFATIHGNPVVDEFVTSAGALSVRVHPPSRWWRPCSWAPPAGLANQRRARPPRFTFMTCGCRAACGCTTSNRDRPPGRRCCCCTAIPTRRSRSSRVLPLLPPAGARDRARSARPRAVGSPGRAMRSTTSPTDALQLDGRASGAVGDGRRSLDGQLRRPPDRGEGAGRGSRAWC